MAGLTQLERFETKVSPEPNTGCWLWAACVDTSGYGLFWAGGRFYKAHRWAYEHFVGLIPTGLQLDHLCRQRCCVNPEHLEPVTHKENSSRGNSGRLQREQTHCVNGHMFTTENTAYKRTKHGRGWARRCRACSRDEARYRYRRQYVVGG